jgi:hypothetical protein
LSCSGEEAKVLRRIGYLLAFGAAAAALAVTGWPGGSGHPATAVDTFDVIAAPVLLAAAGGAARRVFGPPGPSWQARGARAAGYLVVFALVLVKARAERSEYAAWRGGSWLAGLWVGEILFLLALAAYVAALTAVTARRPPGRPATLVTGAVAGAGIGLVVLALPPAGDPLHVTGAWLAVAHGAARWAAIPVVLGGGVVAGLVAARRTSRADSALPLADVRARQGVAAGLCAGAMAALLVSVAGITAAALRPHPIAHSLPGLAVGSHVPVSVLAFETSLGNSAAGCLLVLIFYPVLGAGLGAWGGLLAAGQPGHQPGTGRGGGGGSRGPVPSSPPPGGRRLSEDRQPAGLPGYLPEDLDDALADLREKVPVGAASR